MNLVVCLTSAQGRHAKLHYARPCHAVRLKMPNLANTAIAGSWCSNTFVSARLTTSMLNCSTSCLWHDLGQVMLQCCAVTTYCLKQKYWRVTVSNAHLLIALCKHVDVELVAHDQQGLNCSVFLDCNREAGRIKGRLHVHKPALTFKITHRECSQSCMPASYAMSMYTSALVLVDNSGKTVSVVWVIVITQYTCETQEANMADSASSSLPVTTHSDPTNLPTACSTPLAPPAIKQV